MILLKNENACNWTFAEIDDMHLARLCLDLSGGGFDFEESCKAMEYQGDLLDGKTIEVGGDTYRLEK